MLLVVWFSRCSELSTSRLPYTIGGLWKRVLTVTIPWRHYPSNNNNNNNNMKCRRGLQLRKTPEVRTVAEVDLLHRFCFHNPNSIIYVHEHGHCLPLYFRTKRVQKQTQISTKMFKKRKPTCPMSLHRTHCTSTVTMVEWTRRSRLTQMETRSL